MLTFPFWASIALFIAFFAIISPSITSKITTHLDAEGLDGLHAYRALFFVVGVAAFSFLSFWLASFHKQKEIDAIMETFNQNKKYINELETQKWAGYQIWNNRLDELKDSVQFLELEQKLKILKETAK
jgi:hypothetical protein